MSKLSIVIPARNELYLNETLADLLKKASGDIEIIVVLDGYWPVPMPKDDPRLIIVHRERQGMRSSINSAIAVAKGEYIMKIDAHCMVGEGYDEILKADCDGDWVVIPRRYGLNIDSPVWEVKRDKLPIDYEYLGWPYHDKIIHDSKVGIHAWAWNERTIERIDRLIDENMTFQGSCYFFKKDHFIKRIGNLQNEGYGSFIGEAQEVGLKTWLGGGKVMTNKKTWYAHLWKGEPYRKAHLEKIGVPYTRIGQKELRAGNDYCVDYWMNNKWEKRKYDLEWLIERFMPFPTGEQYQWIH